MSGKVVSIRFDLYTVYIGRGGKGQYGDFGNPYPIKSTCSRCGKWHATGGETLPCYKEYLLERVAKDPDFRSKIRALRGKTLGCFCAPKGGLTTADKPWVCHGQVIMAWNEEQDLLEAA